MGPDMIEIAIAGQLDPGGRKIIEIVGTIAGRQANLLEGKGIKIFFGTNQGSCGR